MCIRDRYLESISSKYRFSYQELRQLPVISADFSMWKSKSVREHIVEIESKNAVGLYKKDILKILTSRWNGLKNSKIHYESQDSKSIERPAPRKVTVSDSKNEVFGMCPPLQRSVKLE